mgnify:CR=1 FL=1
MVRLTQLLIPLLMIITIVGYSQTGRISGQIFNEKNEPLSGVSVKIRNASGGVSSDIDGRYLLTVPTGKKYQIEFSAVGFESRVVSDILVEEGKVTELNVVLTVVSRNLETVTVTAARPTARRETVSAVIAFQKNTNTVASVISAESIRRSPDRTTGDVLKRTPGASLQDGKFLVVRGLADRYNQAMLNGLLLTSTEPDRKTFSFDMIPASMIDNIIINKAFVPELPGEWAGGLVQVNTKDIPLSNFLNIQVGSGFNFQTIGKDFYAVPGGKLDWLGIDDGSRGLPKSYTTKSGFDALTPAEKTEIGKQLPNIWKAERESVLPNLSLQANGGFSTQLFGKKAGGMLGIVYNQSNRYVQMVNQEQSLEGEVFSRLNRYDDDRYAKQVNAGAMASLTVQLNSLNKISAKSIVNVNGSNATIIRGGINDAINADVRGSEFVFRQNTFFTGQLMGEHSLAKPLKFRWYGSFNILDGYTPDQRRIQYTREAGSNDPYRLLISNTLAQESGSRIFQSLSDYIYTAGGDLAYSFDLFGQKQTAKAGYLFQVKDRLFEAKLFANYLPYYNENIKMLPADKVFAPENFGDGNAHSPLFAFDAIRGNDFRYLANTILNAGFLQFDNQFTPDFRVVWGLRMENYDQLVGATNASDPRHAHSEITDFLPGINATYKLNNLTNIRLSGSQTVIRPELRELSAFNLYDFELNASVSGYPDLQRTKVTNLDLRYELYPRAGETVSLGLFYKSFDQPIEQVYSGGNKNFTFRNAEQANSYGVEFEMRKRLDFTRALKNFSFHANAAYIYSRVESEQLKIDRPMQGQSPYLLNFGLMYDLEKAGFNATLLFNQIGKRIFLVGDIVAGGQFPDVWEAPRGLLDFQIGKKILDKRGEIRITLSDLLAQTQKFYQNPNGNTGFQEAHDQVRFSRRFGTGFGITFNYSIL